MKHDSSGISYEQLAQRINQEYDLGIVSIAFLPKGEEAFAYLATSVDGRRHFVRVQDSIRTADLGIALRVIATLHDHCGLPETLVPYRTGRGTYTSYLGHYTVIVFPFIDGEIAYECPLSDHQLAEAARLIGRLHGSSKCYTGPTPLRERFADPFGERIVRAIEVARQGKLQRQYQQRMRQLLLTEEHSIRAGIERMRRFHRELPALDLDWVITHGDPNLANIIVAPNGRLYLIDWGEVAVGPRERDLSAFTGDRFLPFLRHYLAVQPDARLHAEVFAFYEWRWTMQEIADYSTKIIFTNTSDEQDKHDWERLAPYLPIRAAESAQHMEEISRALRGAYAQQLPTRNFALAGAWEGSGASIADLSEEDMLEGFGN